ncbi:MAG: hypothetical protein HYV24_05720 [Deltaproteobacteria bacterium]|nr:hypothetical protein [Deltaproteobacteria bacterium]
MCSQCINNDIASEHPIVAIEFRDDGRYEITCPKGHKSVTILQQQRFEILYEIGACAIIDGYYREAVSSFTSSLENFYEFFIKAVLFEKGIEKEMFISCWKQVAGKSERQLGAFVFLYLSEFGEVPILLDTKKVEFRNSVIHKGKIPTRAEALIYGQDVLNILRPIIKQLKTKYDKGVQEAVGQHLIQCRKENDHPVTTMGISTILSLTFTNSDDSLEKSLCRLCQKMRAVKA